MKKKTSRHRRFTRKEKNGSFFQPSPRVSSRAACGRTTENKTRESRERPKKKNKKGLRDGRRGDGEVRERERDVFAGENTPRTRSVSDNQSRERRGHTDRRAAACFSRAPGAPRTAFRARPCARRDRRAVRANEQAVCSTDAPGTRRRDGAGGTPRETAHRWRSGRTRRVRRGGRATVRRNFRARSARARARGRRFPRASPPIRPRHLSVGDKTCCARVDRTTSRINDKLNR